MTIYLDCDRIFSKSIYISNVEICMYGWMPKERIIHAAHARKSRQADFQNGSSPLFLQVR